MNAKHYEERLWRVHDRRALLVQASDALVFRGQDQLTEALREWLSEKIGNCLGELTLASMELREAKADMIVHEMEQPHLAQLATIGLEMFGIDRDEVYAHVRWCLEDQQYNSARALLKLADLMLEHERFELRQVAALVSEAEEIDKPNP